MVGTSPRSGPPVAAAGGVSKAAPPGAGHAQLSQARRTTRVLDAGGRQPSRPRRGVQRRSLEARDARLAGLRDRRRHARRVGWSKVAQRVRDGLRGGRQGRADPGLRRVQQARDGERAGRGGGGGGGWGGGGWGGGVVVGFWFVGGTVR